MADHAHFLHAHLPQTCSLQAPFQCSIGSVDRKYVPALTMIAVVDWVWVWKGGYK